MKPPRPGLFLIGDVHGQIDRYLSLLATLPPGARSIALGDMYIGRPGVSLPPMEPRHTFLQGNHDDPARCKAHPNFLGRFGYLPDDDVFYVSGAQTASWRVLQNSKYWYADEELSEAEFEQAIDLYTKVRPRVLIAHEFPQEAVPVLLQGLAGNYYSAKADCLTSAEMGVI
jgi:Calcineurin-like phosphoesterase